MLEQTLEYWKAIAESRLVLIQKILKVADAQADDDGLWFVAQTAAEGYLQQELRRLHTVIEED